MIVHPDGPSNPVVAIVGEAPASEEVRQGRGFVGPSGRIIWPVLRRLAGLERAECWVTNLCKHPLDNSEDGEVKLSAEEFEACKLALLSELSEKRVKKVLAVGALAAKALLEARGMMYSKMEVHNGMTYAPHPHSGVCNWDITPCWHPAAALHGNGGKDPLAWMGDAMAHFMRNQRYPQKLGVPRSRFFEDPNGEDPEGLIGVDTEGTKDDPICLTWASKSGRYYVEPYMVPVFWERVKAAKVTLVYHNAPWDWGVLESLGISEPWKVPFLDTMEKAYQRQTEPQGLKDLAYRHFLLPMTTWENTVMPHYNEIVLAIGAGKVDAGTTTTTHTKTGKLRKKPIVKYTDEVKPMKRALKNAKLMTGRIGEFPAPSLRFVPQEEVVEYATLDPFVTRMLVDVL